MRSTVEVPRRSLWWKRIRFALIWMGIGSVILVVSPIGRRIHDVRGTMNTRIRVHESEIGVFLDLLEFNGGIHAFDITVPRWYKQEALKCSEDVWDLSELWTPGDESSCGFVERSVGALTFGMDAREVYLVMGPGEWHDTHIENHRSSYDEVLDISLEIVEPDEDGGGIKRILVYEGQPTVENVTAKLAAHCARIPEPLNLIERSPEDYETPRGIRLGLSRKEVADILGEPTRTLFKHFPGGVGSTTLFYETDFEENECVEIFYTAMYTFDDEDKLCAFMLYDGWPHEDPWWTTVRMKFKKF
ncbi:MAG: hypothetical protein JSV08_05370 [Acidobacteriota bacterium]|nr:MAG: hypothetical protein JSV08_05370 [Acidobacteriota bacterium]